MHRCSHGRRRICKVVTRGVPWHGHGARLSVCFRCRCRARTVMHPVHQRDRPVVVVVVVATPTAHNDQLAHITESALMSWSRLHGCSPHHEPSS